MTDLCPQCPTARTRHRGVSLNPGLGRRWTPGEVQSLPAILTVSEDRKRGLWLPTWLLLIPRADAPWVRAFQPEKYFSLNRHRCRMLFLKLPSIPRILCPHSLPTFNGGLHSTSVSFLLVGALYADRAPPVPGAEGQLALGLSRGVSAGSEGSCKPAPPAPSQALPPSLSLRTSICSQLFPLNFRFLSTLYLHNRHRISKENGFLCFKHAH